MKNKMLFVIIIAGLLMAMGGHPVFSFVVALVSLGVINAVYALSTPKNKRIIQVWWNDLFKTLDD